MDGETEGWRDGWKDGWMENTPFTFLRGMLEEEHPTNPPAHQPTNPSTRQPTSSGEGSSIQGAPGDFHKWRLLGSAPPPGPHPCSPHPKTPKTSHPQVAPHPWDQLRRGPQWVLTPAPMGAHPKATHLGERKILLSRGRRSRRLETRSAPRAIARGRRLQIAKQQQKKNI